MAISEQEQGFVGQEDRQSHPPKDRGAMSPDKYYEPSPSVIVEIFNAARYGRLDQEPGILKQIPDATTRERVDLAIRGPESYPDVNSYNGFVKEPKPGDYES